MKKVKKSKSLFGGQYPLICDASHCAASDLTDRFDVTADKLIRPFLVSARKGPKEADLRDAELIAPAIKARNRGAIATGNRAI